MTVHAQTWDVLATVVAQHRYEDFSSFELECDYESNYARLYMVIHAPNSYRGTMGARPDRPTRHEFMVPCATYGRQMAADLARGAYGTSIPRSPRRNHEWSSRSSGFGPNRRRSSGQYGDHC